MVTRTYAHVQIRDIDRSESSLVRQVAAHEARRREDGDNEFL